MTPSSSSRVSRATTIAPGGLRIAAAGRQNTIGLAERELVDLLDKLDKGQAEAEVAKRDFARWPFRKASIGLHIFHPGGTDAQLKLACRNLSRGGICLLHNGFVHTGTSCKVYLPRQDGAMVEVCGTIVRCAHRMRTLHELGIKFDKQIDLREFVDVGSRGLFSLEKVDASLLKGKTLLVEDCPMTARIVHHYLRETRLSLTTVTTIRDAISRAVDGFDLIISDWSLSDGTAAELLAEIRRVGINAPVIVVTGSPEMAEAGGAGSAAGVTVLSKPLHQDTLLRTIAERVLIRDADAAAASRDITQEISDEVKRVSEQVLVACSKGQIMSAGSLCKTLRGVAAAFNKPELDKAALHALKMIESDAGQRQQREALHDMARIALSSFKGAA
ncbi:MAG: response regulator [Phycisphaeraceae bacterium]|nr:response regulator [Phycisphaeraceae bacterium]